MHNDVDDAESQLDSSRKQQRDLYADLDQRLKALESRGGRGAGGGVRPRRRRGRRGGAGAGAGGAAERGRRGLPVPTAPIRPTIRRRSSC